MSTAAHYDRNTLLDLGVEGGKVEKILVDDRGFLVLVIAPKGRRGPRRRLLLSVSRDHEGNGPGAVLVDTVPAPGASYIDTDPGGAIVLVTPKGGAR